MVDVVMSSSFFFALASCTLALEATDAHADSFFGSLASHEDSPDAPGHNLSNKPSGSFVGDVTEGLQGRRRTHSFAERGGPGGKGSKSRGSQWSKGDGEVHPVFEDPGQDFDGRGSFENLNKPGGYQGELGGDQGFSFFARVKYNSLQPWSRIFDFGYKDNHFNILAGIIKDTPMVFFEIHPGDLDEEIAWMSSPDVQVKVGEEAAWLFVVTGNGKMEIWRDGYLLAEKSGKPVPEMIRPNLFIGKANWLHDDKSDKPFDGSIHDIKIFNQAVDWNAVTRWRRATVWPGLTDGNFELTQQRPTKVNHGSPVGWDSQGTVLLASADGVKSLGGPPLNDPRLLATCLESNGAILKTTVRLLQKGTKYWVSFEAAASHKYEPGLLSVSVGGEEYISKVSFSADTFSKQYFAFVATHDDGTAELEFKNTSPMKQFSKPRIFINDVKISDVPHCYFKYKTQAKCVGDSKTKRTYEDESEQHCREKCEKHRCAFLLFDPLDNKGKSYCETYAECGTMAMYYDGSGSATLYKRQPCAAGGYMAPEMALKYHQPSGKAGQPAGRRPGFNGKGQGEQGPGKHPTKDGETSSHLHGLSPKIEGKWSAKDEGFHNGI